MNRTEDSNARVSTRTYDGDSLQERNPKQNQMLIQTIPTELMLPEVMSSVNLFSKYKKDYWNYQLHMPRG